MKIQPYVEKLNSSQEYKTFNQKYGDAFIMAGFFVLDFEMGNNIHQIDFYIPSKKKIAAFTLDQQISMQMLDSIGKITPEKLDIKIKTDLDELKGILHDEMRNRGLSEEINKIIAVIQRINGKTIWNLNCVLSGMSILRAHVEDSSKSVLKMEKLSMSDIIKKVNPQQLNFQKPVKESAGEQIKKLDKLEEAIKKEKELLKKKALKKEADKSDSEPEDLEGDEDEE